MSTSSSSSGSLSGSSTAPTARSAAQFHIADRLSKFVAPTVWHEFTPMAAETKAVNLGQGFPGWSPPAFVQKAAADACQEVGLNFLVNQYARSAGHLPLVQKLAAVYSPSMQRTINPLTDIFVSVGASEALCALMLGLLNPGDEVVLLEPAFDIYIAQAEMCGASIKYVPLRTRAATTTSSSSTQEWYLDMAELEQAFSAKTRMIILNTPQNPTGKMFTRAELEQIAAIVKRHEQCFVLADEVYENMCYEREHVRMASLPGMWERTVTVSSAGKTFSVTGWKIGWAIGPEHLVRCAAISHQWLSFSTCTPLQQAVADMLTIAEKPYDGAASFYAHLHASYLHKRTLLADALREVGIEPIVPEGGFFIVGDTSRIRLPEPYASDKTVTRDWSLCRWLTKEIGVAAIPPSAFYGDEHREMAANYARFAFCKPDEVLQEARVRLQKVKQYVVEQ